MRCSAPARTSRATFRTIYGRFDADYELTDSWSFNAGFLVGLDEARQQNFGQLCGSCFNLSVNGTTNGGGSTTAPSIPGTTTVVLNTPLTAANSLDPFGGGTAPAVLTALTDSGQIQVGDQTIKNAYFKFDGDLFSMWGGEAQLAVGGELTDYELEQDIVRPNNTGSGLDGFGAALHSVRARREVGLCGALFAVRRPRAGRPGVAQLRGQPVDALRRLQRRRRSRPIRRSR